MDSLRNIYLLSIILYIILSKKKLTITFKNILNTF